MDYGIFDTHAHYNDEAFSGELQKETLNKVFDSGVKFILNAGTDITTSEESIELAKKYKEIYACVGIYPHECIKIKNEEETLNKLVELTKYEKVVGIGEIGLDYHYDDTPIDIQKKWFEIQLDLAEKLDMPVVIHDREAHGDLMEILSKHKNRGILHSFSGSFEMAKELVKMGFYISISGPLTYKNAHKTVEVVEKIGLEYLTLETDSPYLSPVPNRGKINDSSNIIYIAQKISEIKAIPVDEVIKTTCENSRRMFGI